MTYELAFKDSALKEWKKLGHTVKEQFKKKLVERLKSPHVPGTALSGASNMYKIKLRQAGYRLVYLVEDQIVTVTVIAVGKRDRNEVYDIALSRIQDTPHQKCQRHLAKAPGMCGVRNHWFVPAIP